ncbi:MAG: GDYXXLXY domain-containing protein [Candidatus Hydrogenedentes bacterium]|nr:GDYXXLXY domain-containing protein [Candidatus Hydrogenedentota bacterium]
MTTWIKPAVFLAMVAAQIAVPWSMIAKHEATLRTGAVYKFRTQPVDPADAFRGRYVWLQVEASSAPLQRGQTFGDGQKVFAVLATDEQGFAKFSRVSGTRPSSGDYVATKVTYINTSELTVGLQLPLDRYYLEESLAPEAERAYREHSRVGQRDTYITVRVRDGYAVIEELYVNDSPIKDFVRREMAESEPK